MCGSLFKNIWFINFTIFTKLWSVLFSCSWISSTKTSSLYRKKQERKQQPSWVELTGNKRRWCRCYFCVMQKIKVCVCACSLLSVALCKRASWVKVIFRLLRFPHWSLLWVTILNLVYSPPFRSMNIWKMLQFRSRRRRDRVLNHLGVLGLVSSFPSTFTAIALQNTFTIKITNLTLSSNLSNILVSP